MQNRVLIRIQRPSGRFVVLGEPMFTAFLSAFTLLICAPVAYLCLKLPMPTLFKFVYMAVIVLVAGITIILGRNLG